MLIIIYRAYVLINEDEFTVYIRMFSAVPTLTLTQLPFTYFSTYVFAVIFVTALLPEGPSPVRGRALLVLPYILLHAGQIHVLVEAAHAVDDAVVGYLDDSVCDGLGELVVVAGEN